MEHHHPIKLQSVHIIVHAVLTVSSALISDINGSNILCIEPWCFCNIGVSTAATQARSQGGSLGAEEPSFLTRRSISLLKRSTILLKKP